MRTRKAFNQGREAYVAGIGLDGNPYTDENPLMQRWWYKGYEFEMNWDLFEDQADED
jgi:hypothetical protein